jgi:hypothetical protein
MTSFLDYLDQWEITKPVEYSLTEEQLAELLQASEEFRKVAEGFGVPHMVWFGVASSLSSGQASLHLNTGAAGRAPVELLAVSNILQEGIGNGVQALIACVEASGARRRLFTLPPGRPAEQFQTDLGSDHDVQEVAKAFFEQLEKAKGTKQ